MAQIIPLTNDPNQTMQVQVHVNGQNISLSLSFRYNEAAEYWVMDIADPATGGSLAYGVPLVCGDYPAANLLEQYGYLAIGSAYLLNMGSDLDRPDNNSLGNDFLLIWGDNAT